VAVLLALLLPGRGTAQAPPGDAGVRGVVMAAGTEAIGMAVVELRARGQTTTLRTTQSVESGRFQFDGIVAGSYYLLIRRIGFRPAQTLEFTVAAGQVRDLGMIRMEATSVELEPVVVTVERPDVLLEPDRTSYLVEAIAGSPGAVITDALRGIPDLVVDIDGVVRLRGATPAIYVNGRPSPMDGVSLAVFLEQFPADQIERIEILDAPPARFGAEGSAGIINIVLKEGVNLGMTGSLSLSAGTRGQRSSSAHASLQRGAWTGTGSLNANWSDSRNADFTLRQNLLATPTTFLQQDARSLNSSRGGGTYLDVRYNPTKQSRFWARVNGNLNGSTRRGNTATSHLDEVQAPTLWYERQVRSGNDGASGQGTLGYTYSWVPNRHHLEFEVTAQAQDNSSDSRDEIVSDPIFQGSPLLPSWLTSRETGNRSGRLGVEATYVRPWGRQGRIEIGSAFRRNDARENQYTDFFAEQGDAVPTSSDTRLVTRDERTTSAYLTLQRRVGLFGFNAGLRGEMVRSDVTLPGGNRLDRDEANLFPSLNLSWNPKPRIGLRMGYSLRINRPGVSVLDPTDRSTDPLNRRVGNPDLESSMTHNLSANLSWSGKLGHFSVGPYWNRTTDGWEQVTTVDADGISTTTYDNLTSQTNLGTSANWGFPRLWGWRGNVNLSASRLTMEGSLRSSALRDGQIRWSIGGNLDRTLLGTLTAQASFGYQPPRDMVQGRTSGQWRADMSFRYRLLNNRTSVGLSIQDPFLLRKTTQQLLDPSVIQTGSSRVTTRSMSVSVSHAFGRMRGGGPMRVEMGH